VTVPLRRRPTRTQAAAAVLATGAVVAVALVAGGSGGAAASSGPSRTATAEARDLTVTDADRGTLARSDTTTILYDGTGGRADGGPAGSRLEAQGSGDATPAAIEPDPTTTTTTRPQATTTTTAPPPTTTTTRPQATTTTTTTKPPPATTTTTTVPPAPPTSEAPPVTEPVPDPGPAVDDGRPSAPTGDVAGPDEPGPSSSGPPTATLTELLPVGAVATRGSVLYRADDEPIVALLSTTPLYRALRAGVSDGPDVRAVESELRALGYSGFAVDEHFDAATAAAVASWERDLGRADPDGVVTVGEVRLLAEPTTVLEHSAAIGDLLEPDDAVLLLGTESRVIEADVDAEEVHDWAVGTSVTVEWADGSTSSGSVVEVGRDVSDGQVPIVVALEAGAGLEAPIGTRVDLTRVVADRPGAVAVPVSAIVQGHDGPAVRVADGRSGRLVDVELGIVDDGWVEIRKGIDVGTEVLLPS
jgi:hypothetical protein